MKRAMIVVLVAGLSAALGACGSANETGSGGSGAGTTKTSSSSYHCCINDSAYQCPGQAAFDKCSGGGDPQACIDKCSPTDGACIDACFQGLGQGDPSDCEKVSQPVSTFCGSGTGGSGTGGSGTGGSGPVDNTGTCSGSPCSSTEDCAQTYVWCNSAIGHCFDIRASCEGNPCGSEFDCPQNFTCDSTFNTCTAN